jgi:hypothetical protein
MHSKYQSETLEETWSWAATTTNLNEQSEKVERIENESERFTNHPCYWAVFTREWNLWDNFGESLEVFTECDEKWKSTMSKYDRYNS